MHPILTTLASPVRRSVRRTRSVHVLGAIALVAACTGSAYAAATIGSAQVIDNSLRGVDVRNGSLAGIDVANSSLGGADIADGSLSGADVADGSIAGTDLTDASVAGTDLADASVGTAKVVDGSLERADLSSGAVESLTNQWTIRGTAKVAAGGAHVTEQFLCDYPNGEYAAGGGGYSYYDAKGYLTGSTPVFGTGPHANKPIGWEVSMQNLSGVTNYLIVRVTCVRG